jgi:hypothetical protein
LKRKSAATCWTCALATVVAVTAASAIAARNLPASPRSPASTDAAASDVSGRVAAWITVADLVANEWPHSRLSRWCERRLRQLILEPTGPIAQGGPHGGRMRRWFESGPAR